MCQTLLKTKGWNTPTCASDAVHLHKHWNQTRSIIVHKLRNWTFCPKIICSRQIMGTTTLPCMVVICTVLLCCYWATLVDLIYQKTLFHQLTSVKMDKIMCLLVTVGVFSFWNTSVDIGLILAHSKCVLYWAHRRYRRRLLCKFLKWISILNFVSVHELENIEFSLIHKHHNILCFVPIIISHTWSLPVDVSRASASRSMKGRTSHKLARRPHGPVNS